jgi:hypothetical protein
VEQFTPEMLPNRLTDGEGNWYIVIKMSKPGLKGYVRLLPTMRETKVASPKKDKQEVSIFNKLKNILQRYTVRVK